jgi:hypothetical protein
MHHPDDRVIVGQQVKQQVAQCGPSLDRIGLGCPGDERAQLRALFLVGAADDVIPVFSYRAHERIRWLPARRTCFGHGGDVPSSQPPARPGAVSYSLSQIHGQRHECAARPELYVK